MGARELMKYRTHDLYTVSSGWGNEPYEIFTTREEAQNLANALNKDVRKYPSSFKYLYKVITLKESFEEVKQNALQRGSYD
jgi:hypothetical protein